MGRATLSAWRKQMTSVWIVAKLEKSPLNFQFMSLYVRMRMTPLTSFEGLVAEVKAA